VKPILIASLFSAEGFISLKGMVNSIADSLRDELIHDREFNRHHINDHPSLVEAHKLLVPILSKLIGRQVKKSYCFLSIYRDNGICPVHVDRPQCKYTIDLCVSQQQPWPIYVDDVAYVLQEGQALVYSGTDSPHYRHEIQPGNHCTLVFFHFVDVDFEGTLE
jgi:hypothetical protein